MAKIYGIQLKAFRSHMSSDGVAVYGNVYLKNKKIGEIYDDGVGAGLWANFISNEAKEEIIQIVKKFYEDHPSYVINKDRTDFGMLIDFFDDELIPLQEIEKEFKANSKKGFGVTLHLQSHFRNENPFNEDGYLHPIIVSVRQWNDDTKKYIKEKYPKHKNLEVFSKIEDFIIE